MNIEADIAVIGAGVGGSLTAAILQQAGFDVVLIDRARHPRFAIGESSTPAANLLLQHLADKHQLDFLRPICKYGTWCRELPQLRRGLKRGFSYFKHQPGKLFRPAVDHSNELIVAASVSDDVGDTQWLRADVDAYLCEEAVQLGVRFLPQTSITNWAQVEDRSVLQLEGPQDGSSPDGTFPNNRTTTLTIRSIINATAGPLSCLASNSAAKSVLEPNRQANQASASTFQTNTRAIFGHFKGLEKWSDVIGDCPDHPFRCDDSAMHHLLDGAWMWWIRFDDGITSAGLVIDESSSHCSAGSSNTGRPSPESEWNSALAKYPSLAHAFRNAQCINGLFSTGRLQRGHRDPNTAPSFGLAHSNGRHPAQLVELPNALGFVDPLHSTGLAHTISGVDRVTDAFIKFRDSPEQLSENLSTYRTDVLSELSWVDDLICGCYQRLDNFSAFSSFAMCYFAAATTFERRFLANSSFSSGDYSEISQTTVMADQPVGPRFLCSGDKDLQQSVQALLARDPSEASTEFERACRDAVALFNHVGLFAPAIRNMYAYTALP